MVALRSCLRAGWRALALVAMTIALSACGPLPGSGVSLHITNGTDRSWLVSVPLDASNHPARAVRKVDPGADGFSVWFHDAGSVISVLAPDCSVTGIFRDDGTGNMVVDAIPGLTGYLRPGTHAGADGISITAACGGEVSM
jgi:hypothetical protein